MFFHCLIIHDLHFYECIFFKLHFYEGTFYTFMSELHTFFYTFMSELSISLHLSINNLSIISHFLSQPITENFYIFPKVAILKGRIIERTDNTYEAD